MSGVLAAQALSGDGGSRLLRQSGGNGAAGFLGDAGRDFGSLAETDENDSGETGGGGEQQAGLGLLAFEGGGLQGPRDAARARLIQRLCDAGQRLFLVHD